MNDPHGKPPQPDRPTLRPKSREGEPTGAESASRLLDAAERDLQSLQAAEASLPESGRGPDAPPRILPTIGTFGPYAIVGRLALGGMAEILLAREDTGGAGSRYLVVKRILTEYEKDDAFVEMFLDEARVMMRLKHPNVTHVYKFGQEDGTHYIAMEWVNGASLGSLIRKARKTGGIPVHLACKIIAMVAEALDHAHDATNEHGQPLGIVHRDVTPGNIMVSYDGAVKLLDFGIAKAATRAHKTQAGVVKGKFAYMAPEQCRAKELDRRVDVFAMGICLYEAITGRPLYRRETEFETMEAIVRGPIPKLSDRVKNPPAELEAIISKCLAKSRDDRYASAGDLQDALDTYVASRGKVVNARRIKELMDKLFREEQRRGPTVDTTPFGSSIHMNSEVELFAFSTGEGDALPSELPLPDVPGLEGSVTPPYEGAGAPGVPLDPLDNIAPGNPLPAAPSAPAHPAPLATTPQPQHSLARDRRPPPTAPKRPPVRLPPAEKKSSGLTVAIVGVLALVGIGGGAYLAYPYLMPEADPVAPLPTEAPVLTGTLSMASTPPGAMLYVDGVERGSTPVVVPDLTTGEHRVRLALDGYRTHDGAVDIRAGETNEIAQPLDPLTPEDAGPVVMGRLTLTSTPRATVFLDGEELGRTPLRNVEVPAGLVALELETADGERHRHGVMVTGEDTTSAHVDLRER